MRASASSHSHTYRNYRGLDVLHSLLSMRLYNLTSPKLSFQNFGLYVYMNTYIKMSDDTREALGVLYIFCVLQSPCYLQPCVLSSMATYITTFCIASTRTRFMLITPVLTDLRSPSCLTYHPSSSYLNLVPTSISSATSKLSKNSSISIQTVQHSQLCLSSGTLHCIQSPSRESTGIWRHCPHLLQAFATLNTNTSHVPQSKLRKKKLQGWSRRSIQQESQT